MASYVNVGNVLSYSDTADNGASSIMGSWTFQYNAQNQLSGVIPPGGGSQSPSTLLYDAAGDVTSDSHTGNQYVYDAEGRICAFQTPNGLGGTIMMGYLYDASGERVAKGMITSMNCDPASNGFTMTGNNTGTYVLGQGGEELTQLSGNGAWQRTNVFGAGKQLATYDTLGLHFQIEDALGTRLPGPPTTGLRRWGGRRMQTNADGQPETDIQSLPYGDALITATDQYAPATADDATPLHFTGKERDTESGNDYFGARYYASTMGRWLSPDWSAKVEPVPYAKLGDPQTLNLYTYVGNNPLIHIDADGHCWPESLCKAVSNAWNNTKQALNQAGSYFYATGFKGTGDEIKVKVGPLKLEVGEKKGTEVTRHLNGEKEQKEVKQDAHLKAEIGPVSLGVERKQTGDGSKTEWSFSGEVNGVGGSGGQVGVNAEFCHGTCSSIEGGVEAGKALNDLIKNTPPPQPGSLDELMTIAPK